MTERLEHKLLKIGLLMGGNGGTRICELMNISTSAPSLIRLIKRTPEVQQTCPTVVGIDDWAYRKGLKYGTVLVDLEQRKVIDLLPDREATTVTNWLKAHPEVTVVSRDRYVNYSSGVANALPDATQVADRWHLIKNLGDAVKRVLQRSQGTLKQKAKERYLQNAPGAIKQDIQPSRSQLLLSQKQDLMDQVKALYKEGTSIRAISRKLNLNRATVRKYLQQQVALPKSSTSKTNWLVFEDYIKNAIATRPGVFIKDLYIEIKALGYKGKTTTGYANIGRYMPDKVKVIYPKELPRQYWRPAEVSILLYRLHDELNRKEQDLLNYLRTESTEIEACHCLFQKFRKMLTDKSDALLASWIDEAKDSNIKELQSFANGMLKDLSAIKNALTLPWSNGQVEGQINKLKTIKRQMYGRAGFELLRKRMLLDYG